MRLYVAGLTIALIAAGFWTVVGTDGIINAQGDCVSNGAVPADNEGLAADCEALLAARDTLEGKARLNWSAGTPIEDWEGISLGGTPTRVISIRMANRGLSGTIPTELGSLANLTGLWLYGNELTGSIPPELGNLSEITWLYLLDNQLSGSIPSELGNLSNLRALFLSGNQFTGCIPDALKDVQFNDFDRVGLPFCPPQSPGAPSVSMAATTTPMVRLGSPISVTATFSEPVSGFTASDVTVANGVVSYFIGDDGDSMYTFDVTPNAIGVVTVDIAAGMADDTEGYGNTAATQLTLGLPYDDDHDGTIGLAEAIAAVSDYFGGNLSLEHAIAVVSLYFASL